MNTDVALIAAAAERLALAKDAENAATAARIAAESDLEHLVPTKAEGSTTTTVPGWKITTTANVYRSVDEAVLSIVKAELPAALFEKAFRFKPEVITAGVKYLQQNEPQAYAIAAQAITAKPGKTAVKVERVIESADAVTKQAA